MEPGTTEDSKAKSILQGFEQEMERPDLADRRVEHWVLADGW